MNVARLNMSHGEHAVHAESYANVRRASTELGRGVGIVADLQGPKIRLGRFADGPVMLANGAEFTITAEDILGDVTQCGTTHKGLPGDCNPGDTVLVDDGKVKLEVIEVDGPRVRTRVMEGGPVSNNKGINLPGVAVSVPALSDKDKDGPALGVAHRGRLRVPVVRPLGGRRRRRARDHGRDGPADPRVRQGGEAAGGGEPRGHRRRPSTASWSPAATWAWSCPSRRSPSSRRARSRCAVRPASRSSWRRRCSSR